MKIWEPCSIVDAQVTFSLVGIQGLVSIVQPPELTHGDLVQGHISIWFNN